MLLLLYPAEFRQEYGDEMVSLFESQLKREPPLRLWADVIADVTTTALSEHVSILAADMRHSIQVLAKTPRFAFAALLVITLGVSVTTVVFSLINAVLLRSLPYGHAERLAYIWTPSPSTLGAEVERNPYYFDMLAWQRTCRSFERITTFQRYSALLNEQTPQRIGAARVLGNFFRTLEADAQLGRTIGPDDSLPGKEWVVVLSDSLWRSRFGADPGVVGKTVQIDRQNYRVIGVMPKEFSYPHGNDFPGQYQFASLPRTDIWVPAPATLTQKAERDFGEDPDFIGFDAVIGRLRPSVELSQAQAELSAIQQRLNLHHPEGERDLKALTVPLIETAIRSVRPLLRLLTGAVCLVLLMVCVNFSGMLMARAADRAHELGVRAALGAQRSRLVRLMMTESSVLSVLGGIVAVVLSYLMLGVVVRLNPGDVPRFEETRLDVRVLLFGLSVSLAAGLASGILPAISASRISVGRVLRQGGRGIAGVSWRARDVLIVAEIALTVVLLAGAGLLIRSYLFVKGEDKGFAESTLTMSIVLDQPAESAGRLREELMNCIQDIPGVLVAGSVDDLPLSTFQDKGYIEIEGHWSALKQIVSARGTAGEYFRAMQIPLIAGRYLNNRDIPRSKNEGFKTVVVSDSFVRAYFPDRNAVGRRLRINGSAWAPIVGVVGDVRHSSLEEVSEPIIYYEEGIADSLALRTSEPLDTIAASIRRAAHDLDAGFSVTDVRTMRQYVDQAAARRKFQTVTLATFAGVAVLLALIGLYGLLAYSVRQRTAEIGVRLALGASRAAVVRMISAYGLRLASAGLTVGLCLALCLSRVMAGFVYGIHAVDPLTFAILPALLLLVTVAACIGPARKAAQVDPVTALRDQ
jgi:predicted permease